MTVEDSYGSLMKQPTTAKKKTIEWLNREKGIKFHWISDDKKPEKVIKLGGLGSSTLFISYYII